MGAHTLSTADQLSPACQDIAHFLFAFYILRRREGHSEFSIEKRYPLIPKDSWISELYDISYTLVLGDR